MIDAVRFLIEKRGILADAVTDLHFARHPELEPRYGRIGRIRCAEDNAFHLQYLQQAMDLDVPDMFDDYAGWAAAMLAGRNVALSDLIDNLVLLGEVLRSEAPPKIAPLFEPFISGALARLARTQVDDASRLDAGNPLATEAHAYLDGLLDGDRRKAAEQVNQLLARGTAIRDIYLFIFERSQREVGRLWQLNRISVAQEHFCTAATQVIMSGLYPRIFSAERRSLRMVAACIGGDLHEIGLRIIADFFEMDGWDTWYLGANTPTRGIVATAVQRNVHLLAVSATMPYHLREVAQVVEVVRADSRLANLRILVGGRAFAASADIWRKVGADGYASNATEAVRVGRELLGR